MNLDVPPLLIKFDCGILHFNFTAVNSVLGLDDLAISLNMYIYFNSADDIWKTIFFFVIVIFVGPVFLKEDFLLLILFNYLTKKIETTFRSWPTFSCFTNKGFYVHN